MIDATEPGKADSESKKRSRPSLARWIDDYQRYKLKTLGDQMLRVLNTMFGVFAFWNLVRNAVSSHPEAPSWVPLAIGATAAAVGIIIGIAVLLRLPRSVQIALFPATVVGFILSSEQDTALRLAFVPLIALITIVLPPFIVAVANRINRRL